jgi:hypothetical protein
MMSLRLVASKTAFDKTLGTASRCQRNQDAFEVPNFASAVRTSNDLPRLVYPSGHDSLSPGGRNEAKYDVIIDWPPCFDA